MCTETFLTFTCVQRGIPVCASSGDHGLPNTLYFLRITYTTHARGRYNSDAASLKMSRSRCLQLLRRCMNTDNIIRKHAPPLHDATRGVQAHREPLLFTTLLYNIQPVPCGEPLTVQCTKRVLECKTSSYCCQREYSVSRQGFSPLQSWAAELTALTCCLHP